MSFWAADGNADDRFHRNDGAFVGTAQFVPGVHGQAFGFDGTNYVQIPANSTLDVSKITVAGWINPKFAGRPAVAHDADVIFEKFSFSTPGGYIIGDAMDPTPGAYLNDPNGVPLGTPFFTLVVDNTIEQIFGSSPVPNDGQFHFVAGTYDGATMKLYLDGDLVAGQAVVGSITPATGADAFIGHDNAFPRNTMGAVDEVFVADHALRAQKIREIANGDDADDHEDDNSTVRENAALTGLTPGLLFFPHNPDRGVSIPGGLADLSRAEESAVDTMQGTQSPFTIPFAANAEDGVQANQQLATENSAMSTGSDIFNSQFRAMDDGTILAGTPDNVFGAYLDGGVNTF